MINILVSACLLGIACRYDGKSKPCNEITGIRDSADYIKFIPICPECDGGLPIPRLPAEIVGDKVINSEGRDVTEAYEKGGLHALEIAQTYDCKIAVLKEKSPSCGCKYVYDGTFSGKLVDGKGITAQILSENGIVCIDENELENIHNFLQILN
jgi:uncharacterized protein YbbK (DUF523 family)